MAQTDKLTGLVNRQYFDVLIEHELLNGKRQGKPVSLVVFDIDYLKTINDEHGHLEGDRIIREVARLAREGLRKSDIVCRWGGDEFTILLPDCTAEVAHQLVEAVRLRIRLSLQTAAAGERVTISAGVAQSHEGDTPGALLARADERLYKAKQRGRDRVESGTASSHDVEHSGHTGAYE
jgi:diguanylate cyclase (GGDEF)-like protein